MSNNTKNIIVWIIGICVVISIITMYIIGSIQVKERHGEIILLIEKTTVFSIGKVSKNYYTSSSPSNYRYLFDFGFEFNYNGEIIRCRQGSTETDFLTPDISESHFKANKPFTIGEKYLVLVDPKDPQKSVICLDKPIHDSIDFKRYVKEFEEMRLKE